MSRIFTHWPEIVKGSYPYRNKEYKDTIRSILATTIDKHVNTEIFYACPNTGSSIAHWLSDSILNEFYYFIIQDEID